jgi:starch synthase
MTDALKVLFVAAEATPFVKVGGLADVAGSLPRVLREMGVDARLLIPYYRQVGEEQYELERLGNSIPVPLGPGEEPVHLHKATVDGLPVYMIWDAQYLSGRDKVYGFNDDPRRFTFFSRAVIEALKSMDWRPDVIHANDWHTAPVVAWLKVYGRHRSFYNKISSLYTIHNPAYQGVCGRLILTFGQMQEVPHLPVEKPGQVNWMAQGIAHADIISTVSPTCARNMMEAEEGLGLEELLRERQDVLFGILNGIDTEDWNSLTDEALTQGYDVDSLPMRAVNKTALQREVHLPARADVPLVGMITRLDPLKGLDILLPALEELLKSQEVQFVLLGTGEGEYEERLKELQARFPDRVRVILRFDDRLARRIYGGVDLYLMPSQLDPGGLSQMIAMHYGALPLVRATGALADTVVDVTAQPERGTGFVFEEYSPEALVEALERALRLYPRKERWREIQQRAMVQDFSWEPSAKAYVDLYRRTRRKERRSSDR